MLPRKPTGPRLLVTDRNTMVLLERSRVHVDGERVVYHAADPGMIRRFNMPHCNMAVVMLGQGTSITQEAVHKLSDEGVLLAFSGSGGTPILMGTLISYKATEHFRRMLRVYGSEPACLEAAREIMRIRVERMIKVAQLKSSHVCNALLNACDTLSGKVISCTNHGELMAAEAEFARSAYASFCREAAIEGFVRITQDDKDQSRIGTMNRMIDHGNYLAYGVAGAAIWALGIPAHMSVMHGRTRAGGLVFDLADTWKDSVIIPAAATFSATKDEKGFREEVISKIDDAEMIAFSVSSMNRIIDAGETVIGKIPKDNRFK